MRRSYHMKWDDEMHRRDNLWAIFNDWDNIISSEKDITSGDDCCNILFFFFVLTLLCRFYPWVSFGHILILCAQFSCVLIYYNTNKYVFSRLWSPFGFVSIVWIFILASSIMIFLGNIYLIWTSRVIFSPSDFFY